MMSDSIDITIGDAFFVGDGAHASIKRQDSGVLYLSSRNFKDGKLDLSKVYYISEDDYKKHFKESSKSLTRVKSCDVALSIIGSIGEPYLVKPTDRFGLSSAVAFMRPRDESVVPRYFYYWLKGPELQNAVYSIKGGVAQGYVSLEMIRSLPFRRYPLPTQRKIAVVLYAYDDLIENNLRRIKILEEMAQNLYREWFVKFRFPGHQNARFGDSPLGKIPEGWKVVPFTEISDVLSGGTPKTAVQEYWGGSIPFFAPKDSPDSFYVTDTEKKITEFGLKKCNSKLYPKDTVFITARGTVGKVVMPALDMAMNQSCYALRGQQGVSQLYLFLVTMEQIDYLKKNTGGATFDTIVIDTFKRMLIVRPVKEVIDQFSKLIQPVMELILNIIKKNTTLRRTRDLLLPKLISGEVDVSELDINIPAEVTT